MTHKFKRYICTFFEGDRDRRARSTHPWGTWGAQERGAKEHRDREGEKREQGPRPEEVEEQRRRGWRARAGGGSPEGSGGEEGGTGGEERKEGRGASRQGGREGERKGREGRGTSNGGSKKRKDGGHAGGERPPEEGKGVGSVDEAGSAMRESRGGEGRRRDQRGWRPGMVWGEHPKGEYSCVVCWSYSNVQDAEYVAQRGGESRGRRRLVSE